ncbi:MAG TPA: TRAP transporter substrate-binding protein [Candidatus Bilophila faecipullorum]|uniref:TRAP transporter substrate-binding protein n=1 Tax=Candidatus Bilophila faecipullorum TaxID=2838482 RepID=A0A9D1R1L8_9BACT|nr:TRAP transporter substrate-binding protein [uncultured Bilophila sp.]HIW78461.1 TRAP transporter substrate-binding protein [Candidatus Bilophila faecipullorum]
MSRKTLFSLMLSALFLWAASPASAAPATKLTIAMGDPESSEMGIVGNAFKKYVEEKTDGAIEVQCIYGASLGDDEGERFRRVQKGTLDMALGGVANLVPLEKKLGLLTLPYLFVNLNDVIAGTNGAPADLLNIYASEAGLRVLTWTYTGFRYISNSQHPIKNLTDMKGLKMRVPQSAVMIATYKAFGAIPSLIPWTSTFQALQSGEVDGQCYGYIGFRAMKFNEANQKYLTEVHYTYHLQPLVISTRVFDKFSPDTQKILIDAGKHAQEEVLKFQIEQAGAAKRELIASGLQVFQLSDEDEWRKVAFEKVWPEMADFVGGKDIINAYLKACGKSPWE